jgi:cytochrome c biogenesis protein CcdA
VSDLISTLLRAVAMRSPTAFPLAYAAGIVTSAGPCLAPKIASVVGMSIGETQRRRAAVGVAFACGLSCAYALIALSASAFVRLSAASMWVYLSLSAMLILQGVRAIVCRTTHECSQTSPTGANRPSFCQALIAGAAYAFVLSPCCTPIIASVAGIASSLAPMHAAGVAAAFGLGHATPVLAGSSLLGWAPHSLAGREVLAVIGGGTMLALGCYYALLA